MQDLKGQTVNLLTLDQLDTRISKGKDTTYVVNLWATWCAPCIKELPHFEKLETDLKGKKIKILLISVDSPSKLSSTVRPMAKRLKLSNEIFLLNEKSQQVYIDRVDKNWSGALPATIFINRSKGKREFYEKEFTFAELLKTYKSI
jgi:thiol-disulfide isomerase/thioredoxin